MQTVDQGTVIYGVRSEKYPEQACYGIVISARCDIANCKVRRLYYLIAVEAKEWLLSDAGFEMATRDVLNNARNAFLSGAKDNELNGDDLLSFDEDRVHTVIYSESKGKAADALWKKYLQYRACQCVTAEERRKKINTEASKIRRFLENVNSGAQTHLYYLPESAFRDGGIKSKGLIVDLQEIEAISIADMEAICNNDVDSLILDPKSAEHFSSFCWIDGSDCYTGLDGQIISPWCEHLMQRFANAFIRIGLDGATSNDFKQLVSDMQGGNQ